MRTLHLLPLLLLAAACGRGFPDNDSRQLPLTSCEGLDRDDCLARSDCAVEAAGCPAQCEPDATGNCPLPDCATLHCVTRPSPPPASARCEDQTLSRCLARSDCEVAPAACPAVCEDDGQGGCLPCDAMPRCVTRDDAACEARPPDACHTRPDCALEQPVCAAVCQDDGHGGCLPCPTQPRCIPRGPEACEGLSLSKCFARADCEVAPSACPAVCEDDGHGGCLPCAALPQCVTRASAACEALPPDACHTRPDCALEQPVCAAICQDDGRGGCLPCPTQPRCVTARPVDPCLGLAPAACEATPACELVSQACPALCDEANTSDECATCAEGPRCQARPVYPPCSTPSPGSPRP